MNVSDSEVFGMRKAKNKNGVNLGGTQSFETKWH